MNRFDLTPLYRSTIGFDRLASLFDAVQSAEKSSAFPPYNVARIDEPEDDLDGESGAVDGVDTKDASVSQDTDANQTD